MEKHESAGWDIDGIAWKDGIAGTHHATLRARIANHIANDCDECGRDGWIANGIGGLVVVDGYMVATIAEDVRLSDFNGTILCVPCFDDLAAGVED